MVPPYKGKGDEFECSRFRGISLLGMVGKVYGRVLVKRIWCGTEVWLGRSRVGSGKAEGAWIRCLW